jgi:hypothetical protein
MMSAMPIGAGWPDDPKFHISIIFASHGRRGTWPQRQPSSVQALAIEAPARSSPNCRDRIPAPWNRAGKGGRWQDWQAFNVAVAFTNGGVTSSSTMTSFFLAAE